MDWRQRARIWRVCRGSLMKGMRPAVSRAWNQWREKAQVMVHHRWVAAGVLSRLRRQAVSRAWNQWRESTWVMVHNRRVGGGAVRRLRRQAVSRACNQWRESARVMVRNHRIGVGALSRLRQQAVSRACNQWCEQARVMVHNRWVAAGVLIRLRRQAVSRACNQWRESARVMVHNRRVGGGAVRRLRRQAVSRAWNQWREKARVMVYHHRIGVGALSWLRQRGVSRVWNQWHEKAGAMARQQFMLQGALNRVVKRAMAHAWQKWQQTYVDLKFANRAGGGAIQRMLNRKLSMAFEKWQCTAAQMARQQFMLQGALNRVVKRAMARAWNQWQSQARLRWLQQLSSLKSLQYFQHQQLASAYDQLHAQCSHQLMQLHLLRFGTAAANDQAVDSCYFLWRLLSAQHKVRSTNLMTFYVIKFERLALDLLCHWRSWCNTLYKPATALEWQSLHEWQRDRQLCSSINSWRSITRYQQLCIRSGCVMLLAVQGQKLKLKPMIGAINTWVAAVSRSSSDSAWQWAVDAQRRIKEQNGLVRVLGALGRHHLFSATPQLKAALARWRICMHKTKLQLVKQSVVAAVLFGRGRRALCRAFYLWALLMSRTELCNQQAVCLLDYCTANIEATWAAAARTVWRMRIGSQRSKIEALVGYISKLEPVNGWLTDY